MINDPLNPNAKKSNKAKMIVLLSAIVIELAAVIMIVKAGSTSSSPSTGIIFLMAGLVFLIIGIAKKS